jgi:hypothetical protein
MNVNNEIKTAIATTPDQARVPVRAPEEMLNVVSRQEQ